MNTYHWLRWSNGQGLVRLEGENYLHGDGPSYMTVIGEPHQTVLGVFEGESSEEVALLPGLVELRRASALALLSKDPACRCGWVQEDGTWHPCGYALHESFAWRWSGEGGEREMEKTAIKVTRNGQNGTQALMITHRPDHRLTKAQERRLVELSLEPTEVMFFDEDGRPIL